jgi:hypothetical protein
MLRLLLGYSFHNLRGIRLIILLSLAVAVVVADMLEAAVLVDCWQLQLLYLQAPHILLQ